MCSKSLLFTTVSLLLSTWIREVFPVGLYNHGEDFCYTRKSCWFSSSFWPGLCQRGYKQSPINLIPKTPTPIQEEQTLLAEYVAQPYYLQNNGHTLKIQFEKQATSKLFFEGFGLNDNYIFSQLHFHWGPNDKRGSEHKVNYKAYSMEMHVLHYSSKYASVKEAGAAIKDPSGLAVLGVFFQADPSAPPNEALLSIIANMQTEFYENASMVTVQDKLDLKPLLPNKMTPFFSYQGSLTTPICTENVAWTVFENPILISPQEVQAFRRINDEFHDPIRRNYRPIQPLNLRDVIYYTSP